MKRLFNWELSPTQLMVLELAVITVFACVPLFVNVPFRDNIYLTWEGAYRMYQGQMPFVDFGLPMGYAFWLMPALSFKLFGPYFFSLIKIQVVINIVSGLAFMSILRSFTKNYGLIAASTFLYVVSYSFFNYWPWYNHTVIVFEFVAFALLLSVLKQDDSRGWMSIVLIVLSALFAFLSFFTKQDGGAFAVLISGLLLLYYTVISRQWIPIVVYGLSFATIACAFILPLVPHEFGYWFNYGQEPHYSRVNVLDLLGVIFGDSSFIKFYLLLIVLIVMFKFSQGTSWVKNKNEGLFLLLTLGVLGQASVLQVTSYVPVDGNIYFHSFMFYYILSNIKVDVNFSKVKFLLPLVVLIFVWWSGVYWKYAGRIFSNLLAPKETSKNVVSMSSYTNVADTTVLDKSNWSISPEKAFDKIKLPPECIDAIERLKQWKVTSGIENPKVLNMSELTPLADIMGFELEKGMPLWYHLNVAMFDRELKKIESRISNDYYDMVIFEFIPQLNNFYPFSTRELLSKEYQLLFTFQAPREYTTEFIEVYVKKD
ncbi:hypothetical protein N6H18_00365 [Reichenbachiella agarivorans]|uniref:Dolichyl-phosphate-mannose-protein mannosyltransferase n=1 Tax=Reichenbachiella agarivorans TaxID=2979464 RepID=A0ABY6CSS4_9BACT|nr:hypothetical protein [Reichenbachiella agarivorans]UXP32428.1 hypothetical protein N6H18_00365 [Reichenbachiella agarivorans]